MYDDMMIGYDDIWYDYCIIIMMIVKWYGTVWNDDDMIYHDDYDAKVISPH